MNPTPQPIRVPDPASPCVGGGSIRRITGGELAQGGRAFYTLGQILLRAGHAGDLLYGHVDAAGRLDAAVLVVPQPGRTGLLFTSDPRRRRELGVLAQVVTHACLAAPPDRVALAQALVDPSDTLRIEVLRMAGFSRLASLCYMQMPIPRKADEPRCSGGVTLETYDESKRDELLSVLEASYVDTWDCPGLKGLRDTRDVLVGHRGSGRFDPSLWTLARVNGRAAGALLLNSVPAACCVELVYLGVGADFRRRGLARLLLSRGLWLCAGRAEPTLTLAVDVDNAPAMSLYRSVGFYRTIEKQVYLRSPGESQFAEPL